MYELSTTGFDYTMLLALLSSGVLLAIVVYELLLLTDLEGNDINSIEFCKKYNKFIMPEYIVQAVFTVWFLVTFRFVLFLLNAPVLYYHFQRYQTRTHKNDPTKVYSHTSKMGNHLMLKLVFYMVMFFIYLFVLLFNFFSD
ncbi:hypothetical protein PPL_06435 [Heterostelium album PN500]|uniref:Cornichon n=1 Tax=Heterostelium pallidum (strain ATCC 26659 / Pp 5 / PN500) TaxID=670386 RepID=D3BD55_HETP5|nr:hypothetical protein PPL_06435 [Heterostelium album PN500]EFA80847.1 hypothetical protein PPL_06435 [Heterostelium album PN500]|eukprot:XP_020432966.1 hypothetical protein PPL_06435 [Heterostelium album PN500]